MIAEDALDEVHPHYKAMLETDAHWRRHRAILDGFEYASQKKCFLPSAEFETEANAIFRRSITHYQGVSDVALCGLQGAVFGTAPTISSDNELVQRFIEECFSGGLINWMESKSNEVGGMGIGYAFVTAKADPTRRVSDADPGEMVPRLSFFAAEEIDNWDDINPKPTWCKTRRVVTVKDSPKAKSKYYIERWVITDKDVTVYRKEIQQAQVNNALDPLNNPPGEYKQEGEPQTHDAGELPVVDWQAMGVAPFQGMSAIADSSRYDVALLNHESWLAMALYRHAHPVPVMKAEKHPEQLLFGPSGVLALQPQDEFEYAGIPLDSFQAREDTMARIRATGHRAAGLVEETSDNPSSVASGIAMRVRYSQRQKKTIDAFARSCEIAARRIVELAERWITGREPQSHIRVQFHASHEHFELREFLDLYSRFGSETDSPIFHAESKALIASKMHPHLDEEQREAMVNEIRNEGIIEDPAPGIGS